MRPLMFLWSLPFLWPLLFLVVSTGVQAQWTIKHLDENSSTYRTNIRFKDDSLGLMMGSNSVILKSDDAGETWDAIDPGVLININDFQFVGDSIIYAAGDHYTGAGQDLKSMLIRSGDNGDTWDSIAGFPGLQLFSLDFINHDTGMVAGFDAILRTEDGGESWDTVWSITGSGYRFGEFTDISFPDTETGYAIGKARTQEQSLLKFMLKSTDAGISWDTIHTFDQILETLFFLDPDTGFVGSENGNIFKTVDGGESWAQYRVVQSGLLPVLSIQFISDKVGYATGSSDIMILNSKGSLGFFFAKTVDGGEHWQTCDTAGIDLHSVHFLNDSVGFVSGMYSLIMQCGGEITGLPGDYPWHLVRSGNIEEKDPGDAVVNIYPNPARGMVTVETGKPGPCTIIVFDLKGRLLYSGDSTDPTFRIDLGPFPKGIYIITVRSQSFQVNRKIVRL
ncbi:MAG: YCF48-related protein [Bacteroidota bacterium]